MTTSSNASGRPAKKPRKAAAPQAAKFDMEGFEEALRTAPYVGPDGETQTQKPHPKSFQTRSGCWNTLSRDV